jgi:chloramphenicol-sensitive protein RarD
VTGAPTTTPADAGDPAAPTAAERDAADRRLGTAAGIAAYTIWGAFPLVFHALRDVAAGEVLAHRIVWSFVVVVGVLLVRRDHRWLQVLRRRSPDRRRLALASLLISVNWLVYVWAVAEGRVVEAALGYYINPLFTVALGVTLLGERLRRLQVVALAFGTAAVVVLTVAYGRLPWVALVLAASFGGYGFIKKAVPVGASTSLAVELAFTAPIALVALVVLEARGDAAFADGDLERDVLLLSLGIVTPVPLVLFATAARRIPLTLLGLLQYLTPTMQLLCGVVVLGEDLPPERLAGFVLVWCGLTALTVDALRVGRADRVSRRRARPDAAAPVVPPAPGG